MKIEVKTIQVDGVIMSELLVDDTLISRGTEIVCWSEHGEIPHGICSSMNDIPAYRRGGYKQMRSEQ